MKHKLDELLAAAREGDAEPPELALISGCSAPVNVVKQKITDNNTMNDREKQIPPPRSWGVFEDLCHQLFKAVWCDPLAQKVGRPGQAQQGVDIYGSPNGNYEIFQGVQCKAKEVQYGSDPSLAELQREIAKAEAFQPTLSHWIFATTAPVDATLQQKAREISAARDREGRFTVSVLGWSEITSLLCQHKQVLAEFYPDMDLMSPNSSTTYKQCLMPPKYVNY